MDNTAQNTQVNQAIAPVDQQAQQVAQSQIVQPGQQAQLNQDQPLAQVQSMPQIQTAQPVISQTVDSTVQNVQPINTAVNQVVDQGSSIQEPEEPVSSFNKEILTSNFAEIVKPTEEEIKVEDELTNVGIVANNDRPKLDEIHDKIGVKPSAESVPVNVSGTPSINIKLPINEEEADDALKHKRNKFNLQENIEGEYTEDSLPFLATLIQKIFKEMHRRVFSKNND